MPSNRVHYLRQHTYTTRSNKIRKVRTPGGRLTVQYMKKTAKGAQQPFAGNSRLSGLKKMSNQDYKNTANNSRRIARAYGGVITPVQLKEKIMRAFLIEEVKVVKQMIRDKKKKEKEAAKKAGEVKAAPVKPVAAKPAPKAAPAKGAQKKR